MEVAFLLTASGCGFIIGVIAMSIAADRDRRHAERFRSAAALARYQNQEMQAEGSRRCAPDGQHWCDLYDELQPFEEN